MSSREELERAVLTPGREDIGPYPPVGQLTFDRIKMMEERDIDERFRIAHGLMEVFKDGSKHIRPNDERRVQLKRAILMRLEGYSISKDIALWYEGRPASYMPGRETADDPVNALRSEIEANVSDETQKRIVAVNEDIARAAMTIAPSAEIQKVLASINLILKQYKIAPLEMVEMFNLENLPPHDLRQPRYIFTMNNLLQMYQHQLNGLTIKEIGTRLSIPESSVRTYLSDYMSRKAKDALQNVRNQKRKPHKKA